MRKAILSVIVTSLALIGFVQRGYAQASPAAAPPPEDVTFKVDVVLSRYQAEKKVASFPYSLIATSTLQDRAISSLRLGMNVPMVGGPKEGSTQYIGTAIDLQVVTKAVNGRYRVILTVDDSSVLRDAGRTTGLPDVRAVDPVVRNLRFSNGFLLRDGQTISFALGTDQITGETVKGDVTLTVLK